MSSPAFSPDLTPDQLQAELEAKQDISQSGGTHRYWSEDWTNPQDPAGFLQWFKSYHEGRRTPEDAAHMKRWLNFRQRHGAQFVKKPTAQRAQSLRKWAIDPLKLLPENARDAVAQKLKESADTEKEASAQLPTVKFKPVVPVAPSIPKPAVPAIPRPSGGLDRFKTYLNSVENPNRKGFNQKTKQWSTYPDVDGAPLVGPGIKVPRAGAYSESAVNSMFDAQVQTHLANARRAYEAAHGAGSFDRLPENYQHGLADFSYTGVKAPKLGAAMARGDAEAMRREAVRNAVINGKKSPLTSRNNAWWQTFGQPQPEKRAATVLGVAILPRNPDESFLLKRVKNKLSALGGPQQPGDKNLRATALRVLQDTCGLEHSFSDQRLRLLGFIDLGSHKAWAVFELTDHGLNPATYQNGEKETVKLVAADLGNAKYIGPQLDELREADGEDEEEVSWPIPQAIKSASVAAARPQNKLQQMLAGVDMDKMELEAHADIASGKATKRGPAIKRLAAINGLRRNNLTPSDLMVNSVPIVPPAFRPFSVAGDTFIPGDANELYRDLFEHKRLLEETQTTLGYDASSDARLNLYDAQKALYGYGDPVNKKIQARGVSGFLQKIVGPGSPKFSFPLRKLIGKPQDNVGRGVVVVDPDLGMDEIGIPKGQAFVAFAPHIQRRLVRAGISPGDAVKHVKEQSALATRSLSEEITARPVVYSRAPAWHKFSSVGGKVKLIDGDAIAVNPFVTAGMNCDFDGDTLNFHVPASDDAVQEVHQKLMPSKMLFTIRDPDKVMPLPKHEAILGAFAAQNRPAAKKWKFGSEAEALKAIHAGTVRPSDEVEF
jgi:hypothetical protein